MRDPGPSTPDEWEAVADLFEQALAGYLAAHPNTVPSTVTALAVIRWIRNATKEARRNLH